MPSPLWPIPRLHLPWSPAPHAHHRRATVLTGLLAGLFHGDACSVMPGLRRTGDKALVEAMQQVNAAIQNPVCFASFRGSPALAVWALTVMGAFACLARALSLRER